ncbi:MAG: DUF3187 family protein [Steroidobacteraceae bacterium]
MLTVCAFVAGAASPFPVTDQNPLTRGFYHPLPTAARWDSSDAGDQMLLTVANTTNMNRSGSERLLVDAESTELRFLWSEDLDSNWRIRASVPIVHYGGGVLDPVISGFHKALGLPQGSRPWRRDDQFAIEYSRPGQSIRMDQSYTGLGDMSIELGRQLAEQRTYALSVWGGVELPSGNAERLTGNGALDAGAWFSGEWRPRRDLSFALTAGGTRQGSGDLLNDRRAAWVGFQSLVVCWNASNQVYVQAQLDSHDAYIESSNMPMLGSASILTLGGGYRTLSGWRMGFSVSEDIKVTASPDVAFQFTIHPPFGIK